VEVTGPNDDGAWQSVIVRELGGRLRLPALNLDLGLEEVFALVAFPGSAGDSRGTSAS
jgi:hypothetical protein